MKKCLLLITVVTILTGCIPVPKVSIKGISNESENYITDNLKKDDYPNDYAGTGNIYSCRYGIYYIRSSQFKPPKNIIFSELLKQNIPSIEAHKVTLHRFDVYFNTRVESLSQSWKTATGNPFWNINVAPQTGAANIYLQHKNIHIDKIPETYPINTEENAVGCDGANEGEYFASRVPKGHHPIVIWLIFSVDEADYHFRAIYPMRPQKDFDDVQSEIGNAIKLSIKTISENIKIQEK